MKPFEGFTAETIDFLWELRMNNSREWMEDALSDYEQTLLFVSHDRYFIEKFATRIWALADGKQSGAAR